MVSAIGDLTSAPLAGCLQSFEPLCFPLRHDDDASMFCASELDPAASQSRKLMRRSITVSGVSPVVAVVSKTSGLVYEKSLILKYIRCASRD